MISFKAILNETFLKYRKKFVFDTKHSIDRAKDRNATREEVTIISKLAIDKLKHEKTQQEYLVFSKSLNRGIVFDYRKDRYTGSDELYLYIITILPKGKKNPKPDTKLMLVENEDFANVSQELGSYLSSIVDVNLQESDKQYDYSKVDSGYGFNLIFTNNKLYDLNIAIVEVD
jgi:hypothetical protein